MAQKNAKPQDLALHVLEKLNHSKLPLPVPPITVLEELFECMFFTSMRTEESDLIKVTVTLIDPENPDPRPPKRIVAERWSSICFELPLEFTIKNLVKLSKASDPSTTSLAVYYDAQGKLSIWGMIDQAIHYHNFLNYESESGSEQPGLFQVTISDIGTLNVLFDYELLATLKQNTLVTRYLDVFTIGPVSKILKANAAHLKIDLMAFLAAMHPGEDFEDWESFINGIWIQTLSRLLLRIQNYHHGGAILITDDEQEIDIKYRIRYDRLKIAISKYAKETINNYVAENLIDGNLNGGRKVISKTSYLEESRSLYAKNEIADEIKGAISFLSSHTCVDGVLLFDRDMVSKGFGAVLKARRMPKKIFVSGTATATPKSMMPVDPNHFGTRHRSMIAYCWNYPGSLGLVISQDGDIRAFYRIDEKLIMWENIKTQQFLKSRKLKRQAATDRI
ncbi:putative sensor domain DACNV-containing protein [Mucilaginibacter polytrichastri]|uniref:Probable sensor domain-containing protein n=1 Tax=Mucilaginibacter polytrichastri TaxID=1302689 RepID=A0A1Q5ZZU4_9SPHI|nr:hypothetical protein [Mucilaginibacter polytrichastri]OKS87269.1 hypothetical protein RG47T_2728 [Mucilaginibacter polytrichastri]SFT18624.1 hypothetical protein SAMN04487890_11532 [Mucilaginibacter polytrichastri]